METAFTPSCSRTAVRIDCGFEEEEVQNNGKERECGLGRSNREVRA
jgi:hypothetical protein